MQLSNAAASIHAEHIGADVSFSQVSTDTRSLAQGDLFVALQGEHFDGHEYLRQAQEAGAVAAMVSRIPECDLPLLKVDDTRLGLGQLAAVWRQHFTLPLAAVTGSNGKTTVKEMIASIMHQRGDVLATHGNLNNDIGVPLTLLRLQEKHRYAVIEMGANHAGEIGYLCTLARPDVAVVTNAAAAHLEGFGSIEGVAQAKGEIFSGLGSEGIAVINADDTYTPVWIQLAGNRKVVRFGLVNEAEISADWKQQQNGVQLDLRTPAGQVALLLPMQGQHNVMNALAATATALAMGADLDMVRAGLTKVRTVAGRLQTLPGLAGMQILNDTYNANPASLQAAIDVLAGIPGEKWLVLGDMGELGIGAEQIHADCGKLARASGITRLYALGELSRNAVDSFGDGACWFANHEDLIRQIRQDWRGEGALLVKGSRLMRMEEVVNALRSGDTE
jgi:UDP-N-acetylmuramoyl-tripeptide--D-alanyl-D-alanine ligase